MRRTIQYSPSDSPRNRSGNSEAANNGITPTRIAPGAALWPARLSDRLAAKCPAELYALGNLDLLGLSKTALFCSARCPGAAILRAYDQATHWRDTGRCIISGFHSPIEKECLRILLRGSQPIIICPARSLPQRVPEEWRQPLAIGRLLILSGFQAGEKRITAELASRRNEFVAALADEVWFAHITVGGQADRLTHRLTHRLTEWRVPFSTSEKP